MNPKTRYKFMFVGVGLIVPLTLAYIADAPDIITGLLTALSFGSMAVAAEWR